MTQAKLRQIIIDRLTRNRLDTLDWQTVMTLLNEFTLADQNQFINQIQNQKGNLDSILKNKLVSKFDPLSAADADAVISNGSVTLAQLAAILRDEN